MMPLNQNWAIGAWLAEVGRTQWRRDVSRYLNGLRDALLNVGHVHGLTAAGWIPDSFSPSAPETAGFWTFSGSMPVSFGPLAILWTKEWIWPGGPDNDYGPFGWRPGTPNITIADDGYDYFIMATAVFVNQPFLQRNTLSVESAMGVVQNCAIASSVTNCPSVVACSVTTMCCPNVHSDLVAGTLRVMVSKSLAGLSDCISATVIIKRVQKGR